MGACTSTEPVTCAGGCGNYGHAATGNYCRTCYDKKIAASKKVEYPAHAGTKMISTSMSPTPQQTTPQPQQQQTYTAQPQPVFSSTPQPQISQSPSPASSPASPYQPPPSYQQAVPQSQQPQQYQRQPQLQPQPQQYQPQQYQPQPQYQQPMQGPPPGCIQINCPNPSCRCLLNAPSQQGVSIQCPRCRCVFTHGVGPIAQPMAVSTIPVQAPIQTHSTTIINNNGGGYYRGGYYSDGGVGVGVGAGLVGGLILGAALADW